MPRASGVPSLDGMTGIVQGLLANLVRAATPLAVGEAADRLGTDFFCNRLPPPSVATCTLPLPTIEDEVELLLCPPQHRRLVYVDRRVRTGGIISTGHDVLEDHEAKATLDLKEEDALEADTDGPLAYLQLQHCLQNRREQHMALPRGDPMAEACGPKGADSESDEGEEEEVGEGEVWGGGRGRGAGDNEAEEHDDEESEDEAIEESNESVPPALRLTFPLLVAPALEVLITSYPEWVPRSCLYRAVSSSARPAVDAMLMGCWSEGVMATRHASSSRQKESSRQHRLITARATEDKLRRNDTTGGKRLHTLARDSQLRNLKNPRRQR